MPALTPSNRRTLVRQSVRKSDMFDVTYGGLFHILVPALQQPLGMLPPQLPAAFDARDRVLYSTPRADAQWGSAIGIAISKVASMAWQVQATSGRRTKRVQQLLLNADSASTNPGWIPFIGKCVRDYTCCNNGVVIEVVRESRAYGSRISGINHLPSIRCRRTGDPERPIIYIDRMGREHVMRWWEVITLVDMPESDDWYFGAGLCGAERAYQQIRKLAALEQYVYEKVSGSRPLAIHIVNGMSTRQLEQMLASAEETQRQKGLSSYMGAIIAATIKPDEQPGLVTIPLAELPDGFDAEKERARADLVYSNALGLDPQDIHPMGGQQMGAGAQSVVLHEKGKGRGLTMFYLNLTAQLNQMVLDSQSKFFFIENDLADRIKQAEIFAKYGSAVANMVRTGLISPAAGQQLLADLELLSAELLPEDLTPIESLGDGDKAKLDLASERPSPPEELLQTVVGADAAVNALPVTPSPTDEFGKTLPMTGEDTPNTNTPMSAVDPADRTQRRAGLKARRDRSGFEGLRSVDFGPLQVYYASSTDLPSDGDDDAAE